MLSIPCFLSQLTLYSNSPPSWWNQTAIPRFFTCNCNMCKYPVFMKALYAPVVIFCCHFACTAILITDTPFAFSSFCLVELATCPAGWNQEVVCLFFQENNGKYPIFTHFCCNISLATITISHNINLFCPSFLCCHCYYCSLGTATNTEKNTVDNTIQQKMVSLYFTGCVLFQQNHEMSTMRA